MKEEIKIQSEKENLNEDFLYRRKFRKIALICTAVFLFEDSFLILAFVENQYVVLIAVILNFEVYALFNWALWRGERGRRL